MGRHRSTIYRELERNACNDDRHRISKAISRTTGRRARSRRKCQFGHEEFKIIKRFLRKKWSPMQVASTLKVRKALSISHETIYQYIWADKTSGGKVYIHLRQAQKKPIPACFDCFEHIARRSSQSPLTTELNSFHGYKEIEKLTGIKFYFATPYHSWERGTNENTNGLIRHYLPKRKNMASLTQKKCSRIAYQLNIRPRERHDFKTPLALYKKIRSVALLT